MTATHNHEHYAEHLTTTALLTTRTYTVNNAIAFHALELPLPPGSMIFWGPNRAPGGLLLNGIHYLANANGTFVLGPIMLGVGDTITVVTINA